jgi:hypothetical protein
MKNRFTMERSGCIFQRKTDGASEGPPRKPERAALPGGDVLAEMEARTAKTSPGYGGGVEKKTSCRGEMIQGRFRGGGSTLLRWGICLAAIGGYKPDGREQAHLGERLWNGRLGLAGT